MRNYAPAKLYGLQFRPATKKAFWTILDANVTTLAVAAVLYHFGTGPIKGFAITLGIGIFASMFTAIVVTREIYGWVLGGRSVERLSIGREVIRNTTIGFLGKSRKGIRCICNPHYYRHSFARSP